MADCGDTNRDIGGAFSWASQGTKHVSRSRSQLVVERAWLVTGTERVTLGALPPVTNRFRVWLADGVGLVRVIREGAGTTVDQQLTAIEEPAP